MAHSVLKPLRWQEYLLIKVLSLIEGFALRVLPRGAMRKQLLDRVDRQLERIHSHRCGNP